MQIITVANQKGGTGKTTTALALAQAAAFKGKNVLAVDLDPQKNFSFALGSDPEEDTLTSYQLITGVGERAEVQTNNGIDIIPATSELSTLTSGKGTARRLQTVLRQLKDSYDYIIIDTPPTAGEMQYNALQASTGLIIPLEADAFNIQALCQIADTATLIRQSNPDLKILGYVITQYNERTNLSRQLLSALNERADSMNIPFLGTIRKSVVVQEAEALQVSLFEYALKSNPAQDYLSLFEKIDA